MRDITTMCIHHSASLSGNVPIFRAEHKAKGWADIGYHAVIGNGHGQKDGVIANGRPPEQVGAAVFGANTGKLHVCLVGNFHKSDKCYTGKPTPAQIYSLGYWLCIKEQLYGKPHQPLHVTVHRDAALHTHPTACPGSDFPVALIYEWWQKYGNKYSLGEPVPNLADFLVAHHYWK